MLNKTVGPSHEVECSKVHGASMYGGIHRNAWQRIARGGMIAALLLGGLAGCGGSDGDSGSTDSGTPPPTTPPTSQTIALDGFSAVRPGVTTRVDLSAFVRGSGATLTSMSSEQAGCSATNLKGLSAEVTSDSGLCEFTYQVSGQSGDASATLNTLASDKASPVIPPVSGTMTLAEPSKAFDLELLLGADWPVGYSLDPNSLIVQGGSAPGTAIASGNVVTYTHPGEAAWNRILFTLTDPAKPGEDAFGALYVTVSDSVNQPPVIGTPKYDYNAQNGSVSAFVEVTLDLETLPGLNIVDPESEEWQLVEVQSYSASVAPSDPNSVTNKKFTFMAGSVGDHIVSYIVGDHKAGFAMGLIKVTVGADESPKSWNNIIIGEQTFLATPLYSEVIDRGVMAEPVWDDVVANTVAGVTGSAATSYCSNGNHLALLEELELLRTTPDADAERLKYPVERTYITYNSAGQPLTYELNTGVTAPYSPDSSPNQYVICVNDGDMSYTSFTTDYGVDTGLSDSAWWSLGELVSDGGALAPVVIASTNIGTTALTEANVQLIPSGCPLGSCKVEVQGDVTTYGQFTVEVANAVNPVNTVAIPLTLLQDAKVVAAEVGINNRRADGISANTVVVTVHNVAGAPLANTGVKLKYSAPAGVTISPASCEDPVACTPVTTDDSGNLTLTLTSSTPGDYVITFPDDSLVGGLPTEGALPACENPTDVAVAGVGCFSTATSDYFIWANAESQCTGLGSGYTVPSVEQLLALYAAYPDNQMSSVWGWPTNQPYWSNEVGTAAATHKIVSLVSGEILEGADDSFRYLTCIR